MTEREYKGFIFKARGRGQGHAHKLVEIEKVGGEWPPDGALITIADDYSMIVDGVELTPRHFGGDVIYLGGNRKMVKVYTD